MPMPKTAVHEDDFASGDENKVRTSRQPGIIRQKAIPKLLHKRAHGEFGLCV